jgi:hypothetical protein
MARRLYAHTSTPGAAYEAFDAQLVGTPSFAKRGAGVVQCRTSAVRYAYANDKGVEVEVLPNTTFLLDGMPLHQLVVKSAAGGALVFSGWVEDRPEDAFR